MRLIQIHWLSPEDRLTDDVIKDLAGVRRHRVSVEEASRVHGKVHVWSEHAEVSVTADLDRTLPIEARQTGRAIGHPGDDIGERVAPTASRSPHNGQFQLQ